MLIDINVMICKIYLCHKYIAPTELKIWQKHFFYKQVAPTELNKVIVQQQFLKYFQKNILKIYFFTNYETINQKLRLNTKYCD